MPPLKERPASLARIGGSLFTRQNIRSDPGENSFGVRRTVSDDERAAREVAQRRPLLIRQRTRQDWSLRRCRVGSEFRFRQQRATTRIRLASLPATTIADHALPGPAHHPPHNSRSRVGGQTHAGRRFCHRKDQPLQTSPRPMPARWRPANDRSRPGAPFFPLATHGRERAVYPPPGMSK